MFSKSLIEKRDAALAEADAVVALAESESRELTETEDAEIVATLVEVRSLDEQIASHLELEKRSKEAAELRKENKIAEVVNVGGAVVKFEARTYTRQSSNNFLADAFASQFHSDSEASQRIARHMGEERIERRAVGTSAFAGLVVPQYLTDLAAPLARAGRPYADIMRKHPLPDSGMTLNISKVTTGTTTAAQTENNAASETDMDDTLLTLNVKTVAGQQTVSRQAIERGTGIDQIVMEDLVRSYHTTLDAAAVAELTASAGISVAYTDASPTVGELYPKLANAIQQIQTAYFGNPDFILMHPRRLAFILAALDSTGRPLAVPAPVAQNPVAAGGQVVYGNSGYQMLGLPIVTDANVLADTGVGTNEDTIYVGVSSEAHLWEQANSPLMLRFDQTSAASLGILVVVFGYNTYTHNRYPNAFAKITGTGCITPTF